MKKILFRKLLLDCLLFFLISLLCLGIIIWVFQAVNYMDIIIEDGRDYLIYLNFTFLNFPKILSKIFPFAVFFSFTYIISRYELNNELMIFWNYGVYKIRVVNYLVIWSIFLMTIQIILTSYVVPKFQDLSRSLLRNSNVSFVNNFLKTKNFNDTIKGLTIFIEDKDNENNLKNIYLKKQNSIDDFQITYAKKGYYKKNDNQVIVLLEGESLRFINGNVTKFSFSKSDYSLINLESNSTTYIKTQENPTLDLIKCIMYISDKSIIFEKNFRLENCTKNNLNNIYGELYKRLIIPIYIPILILTSLSLIFFSKEKVNYLKYRIFIFIIGFITIIFSETTLRLITDSLLINLIFFILPLIIFISIYTIFYFKLRFN